MILKRLTEFLDANGVKYTVIPHAPAYTAQEVAASAHISGKELAKTVMVNVDGKMTMTVLPASHRVQLELLREALGATDVELANEVEFKEYFPDCEVGAMPPFGNLFNLQTVVASALSEDEEIAFNAGTHKELIRMRYEDFERLVQPTVARFSVGKKPEGAGGTEEVP